MEIMLGLGDFFAVSSLRLPDISATTVAMLLATAPAVTAAVIFFAKGELPTSRQAIAFVLIIIVTGFL